MSQLRSIRELRQHVYLLINDLEHIMIERIMTYTDISEEHLQVIESHHLQVESALSDFYTYLLECENQYLEDIQGELNPECKTLLALQLATSERYVAALIDQFENYQKRQNEYPRTIIFDFTRNEDNIASRESIPLNS